MTEYLWLLFALIATFARGINSFFIKIYSARNYNKNLIIMYDVLWSLLFSSIYLLFNLKSIKLSFNITEIILIILVCIAMVLGKKVSLLALDNLSSSIFFINTRIFTTLLIVILSMIFLNEFLTLKQLLGIVTGAAVFVLLFEKTDVPKKNSNFKLGLLYLTIIVIIFSYLNIAHKYVMLTTSLPYYIFLILTGNVIFSFLFYYKNVKHQVFNFKKHFSELRLTMISSLMQFLVFIFLFKAYLLQNIAIIYKIFSFEIFIPITLSIIIYKEKITLKKSIAFGFTILTILFFI